VEKWGFATINGQASDLGMGNSEGLDDILDGGLPREFMVNARHPPEWRPQQVVQIAMKGNDHGKRRSLRGVEMESFRWFPLFMIIFCDF
jgi:hypothetical protein